MKDDIQVIDEIGNYHSLFSLWISRKVLVGFTRHMGCLFCKEQVAALKQVESIVADAGVTVIVITNGNYEDIPRFKEETGFMGEVYVDTTLLKPITHNAVKLKNGKEFLFAPNSDNFLETVVAASNRAASKGFNSGGYASTPDSPWTGDTVQVSGLFVLGPGNTCDYSFRGSYVGDMPDMTEVVVAATGKDYEGDEHFYTPTLEWNNRLNANTKYSSESTEVAKEGSDSSSWINMSTLVTSIVIAVSVPIVSTANDKVKALLLTVGIVVVTYLAVFAVETQTKLFRPKVSTPTAGEGKPSLSTSLSNSSLSSSSSDPTSLQHGARPPLRLLTPVEVDKMTLDSGVMKCDCSFLKQVNMIGKMRAPSMTDDSDRGDGEDAECSEGSGSRATPRRARDRAMSELVTDPSGPSLGSEGDDASDTEGEGGDTSPELEYLQAATCYVREFLAKPNPHLGRKGPTCPFVPSALKMGTVHLGVVTKHEASSDRKITALVQSMVERFQEMEPRTGPKATYKAIILIFPDIALADAPKLIDGVQRKLKPLFVEQGLMVGEFHMHNNAPGLHNPDFYPLRTPHPCMAIRHMVPSDIVFLNPSEFPPETRRSMIAKFLDKFGGSEAHDKEAAVARKLLEDLE